MTGEAAGGGVTTTGASLVRVPGTLAAPAASALSIDGALVVVGVITGSLTVGEADGEYGSAVRHPALAPMASASKHPSETFQVISTSKARVWVHGKCQPPYSCCVLDDVKSRIAAWGLRSRADRLARLAATPGELRDMATAAAGDILRRRPAVQAWAPIEVVCHLRDLEESFQDRLTLILTDREPHFPTTNPARWARERQYLRQDLWPAVDAFSRRREATLALFGDVESTAWERAGYQVDSRGRRTVDDFLSVMAWHDENHLAQLTRALAGLP
jgi:hypothetical protein